MVFWIYKNLGFKYFSKNYSLAQLKIKFGSIYIALN
jgi:hypothetical protein